MEERNKDMILHTCKSEMTMNEFQEMVRHFPKLYYWRIVLNRSIIVAFITVMSAFFSGGDPGEWLILFGIAEILILILGRVMLSSDARRIYQKGEKKKKITGVSFNEFYEDYFVTRNENIAKKTMYMQMERLVETNTNLYLYGSEGIYIFQKSRCDEETITFIREKCAKRANKQCKQSISDIQNVESDEKRSKLKKRMLILFIATLLSVVAGGAVFLVKSIGAEGIQIFKNLWVFWIWLPIPLASIIFGFRYEKARIKFSALNIVAGFVVTAVLGTLGAVSFIDFSVFESETNTIEEYEEALGIDLPAGAEGQVSRWEYVYDEDMKNVIETTVYFEETDAEKIKEQVDNNSKWIPGRRFPSKLKIFTTSTMYEDNETYIYIYNDSLDEWNKLPEESGLYRMYTVMYDPDEGYMLISKYDYSYKE